MAAGLFSVEIHPLTHVLQPFFLHQLKLQLKDLHSEGKQFHFIWFKHKSETIINSMNIFPSYIYWKHHLLVKCKGQQETKNAEKFFIVLKLNVSFWQMPLKYSFLHFFAKNKSPFFIALR